MSDDGSCHDDETKTECIPASVYAYFTSKNIESKEEDPVICCICVCARTLHMPSFGLLGSAHFLFLVLDTSGFFDMDSTKEAFLDLIAKLDDSQFHEFEQFARSAMGNTFEGEKNFLSARILTACIK